MRYLPYLSLVVLGVTLVVYPTALNPGLPLILSGFVLVLAALARLAKGAGKYYYPASDLAALLALWLALSLSFHRVDLYLGYKSLATFLGAVGLMWLPQLGVEQAAQSRRVARAFFFFLVLVSVAAWLEEIPRALVSGHLADFKGRFANPDTFSVVPMVGFCLSLGFVERATRKSLSWYLGSSAFLLLTVLVTGCRAAVLGVLLGVGVFLFSLTTYRSKEFDQTRYLLVVPIIVGLLALGVSAWNFGAVAKYAATFTGGYDVSGRGTRQEVNTYGWFALGKNPIGGWGPGAFGLAYQSVRPAGHDNLYVDIAHNDYMEMAVEGGLVGLSLWLAMHFMVVRKLWLSVRKGKRPFFAAGLLAALLSLMGFSVVNFVLPERPVLWVMFFVLGIGAAFPSTRLRYGENARLRVFLGACMLVGGCFSAWFGVRSVMAERMVAEAVLYERALLKEQELEALEKAIHLQPWRANLYLDAARAAQALELFEGNPVWRKRQAELLQRAEAVSPRNIHPRLNLARLHQREGEFDLANQDLEGALAMAPHRRDLHQEMVDLNVRQKRFGVAAEMLGDLVEEVDSMPYRQLRGVLALYVKQDRTGAKKLLKQWREGNDGNGKPWLKPVLMQLVEAGVKNQEWDAADAFLEEALYYDPDSLCLKFRVATITGVRLGAKDELSQLEALMGEAATLRGDCAREVVERYLSLLLKGGEQVRASKFLEDRVREYPRSPDYRLWLSALLRDQGDVAGAQKILRQGLNEGISSAKVSFELGQLYEKQGSKTLAATYYREALQEEPGMSVAKQALDRVLKH